ncbi:MAG: hypothetical protein APR55_07770 [Methanolinea sp. SDB]|nr:MAG: hypothetical protein APR55_07770 [Methanolinea sp. SDB]
MKKSHAIGIGVLITAIVLSIIVLSFFGGKNQEKESITSSELRLAEPRVEGKFSLEQALQERRSIRDYSSRALTLAEVSQVLWAAQGITGPSGLRTAPSARALYPLELYLVAGDIQDLSAGIYHYVPSDHSLVLHRTGDVRGELCSSALDQVAVRDAPAVIIITAFPSRTMQKYGERGTRYVWLEAGHASQNICLQAVTLGLGTVPIGAFDDLGVSELLELDEHEEPIYLMPIGAVS